MTDRRDTDVLDLLLLDAPPLPAGYGAALLHRARRRRRVRRIATLAATGLGVAAGGGMLLASRHGPDRTIVLAPSPSPTALATPAPAPVPDGIAIQAAAVRRLADEVGDGRRWPVLFVLDRRHDGIVAPDPEARRQAEPIPAADQRALAAALADYAPVEFLADREDAYPTGTSPVRNGGALVTLGKVRRVGPDRAELSISVEVGPRHAQGVTYRLARGRDGWAVVGTTGAEWIS